MENKKNKKLEKRYSQSEFSSTFINNNEAQIDETVTRISSAPKNNSSFLTTNKKQNEITDKVKFPSVSFKNHPNNVISNDNKQKPNDNDDTRKEMTLKRSSSGIFFKYYDIDFIYAGLAIMIVNYKFRNSKNDFKPKVYDLTLDIASFKVLQQFNFKIIIKQNQTKCEILNLINDCTTHNFLKYASFFFCMTSHGYSKNVIYSSDEEEVDRIEEIEKPFYFVKSLKDKPKIFLFDCCRGGDKLREIVASGPEATISPNTTRTSGGVKNKGGIEFDDESTFVYDARHFFIGLATVESFTASIQKAAKRSYFIWSFFDVLKDYETIEWADLGTATSDKMKEKGCEHPPSFENRANIKFEFVKKKNLVRSASSASVEDQQIVNQKQRAHLEELEKQLKKEVDDQFKKYQNQLKNQFEMDLKKCEEKLKDQFELQLKQHKLEMQKQIDQLEIKIQRETLKEKQPSSQTHYGNRFWSPPPPKLETTQLRPTTSPTKLTPNVKNTTFNTTQLTIDYNLKKCSKCGIRFPKELHQLHESRCKMYSGYYIYGKRH